MARPIAGGIRENIVKQKRANGIVYVIRRTVSYDPETRRNKVLKTEIIGKLDADGNVVPTRFKAPSVKTGQAAKEKTSGGQDASGSVSAGADRGGNPPAGKTRRLQYGLMSLLEWAGKASGIDDDLKKAMPEQVSGSLAERIIAMARFWVATGADTFSDMHAWQIMHGIEKENMISEELFRKIFGALGIHDDYLQAFFQRRAARFGDADEVIAYDCADGSAGSGRILVFCSSGNDEPIAFHREPGNMPHAAGVKKALKQLDFLPAKEPLFVTDAGFYAPEIIVKYTMSGMHFQTGVPLEGAPWIKDAVMENIDKIGVNNIISFDHDVSGITVMTEPELSYQAPYDAPSRKKGDIVRLRPRIYLSILRSDTRYAEDKRLLIEKVSSLRQVIAEGRDHELSETELKTAEHFLNWSRKGNGEISVSVKEEVFKQHEKRFGVFCYASDKVMDPGAALKLGRQREHLAETMELFRKKAERANPRVTDDDSFRGQIFVQFIALCYQDFFLRRIGDIKKTQGKPNGAARHDLPENLIAEKTLLNWLMTVSLSDIMQWFDAVEMITRAGKRHNRRDAVTENARRDTLFLQKLGYFGGYPRKS